MKDKKVLYVSSEVSPYLPDTQLSLTAFNVAKGMHLRGVKTRIFMPRFGVINERRHQLHEVIRLSGVNLIVNDIDMPLIIKVSSIPKERMQVYFIDNDEYFKRKAIFTDEDDKLFSDNDERAIFFAKGVIETVRKLNWAPDIIHIHGWMASLLPLYLREYYNGEPLFRDSKIVVSVYNDAFKGTLNNGLAKKIKFDKISKDKTAIINPPNFINMLKSAISNSDAVIKATESIDDEISLFIEKQGKPVLEFEPGSDITESNLSFYDNSILN